MQFISYSVNADEVYQTEVYKSAVKYLAIVQGKQIDREALDKCGDINCIKNAGYSIIGLNVLIEKFKDLKPAELKDALYDDLVNKDQEIKKDGVVLNQKRIEVFPTETELFKNSLEEITNAPLLTNDNKSETIAEDNNDKSTSKDADSESSDDKEETESKVSTPPLLYFIGLLSLLSLLLGLFLLFKTFNKKNSSNVEKTISINPKNVSYAEISKIEDRINKEIEKLRTDLNQNNLDLKNLNAIFQKKQNISTNTQSIPIPSNAQKAAPPVINKIAEVVQKESEIRYAKSSFQKSFYVDDLKSLPNKECIFELHIIDNQAKIVLSQNKEANHYVFSFNPKNYFSEDICNVLSGDISIAQNVSMAKGGEGKALLSTDGKKWDIVKRLDLSFS